MKWSVTITEREYWALHRWLIRPDGDEHAAFLFAGLHQFGDRGRLLVRRVVPVADKDFGPSERGAYRAISARAIARAARQCDDEGLCLLWAHSHPGATSRVGFSTDDIASHERMHPHLIDLTHDRPVGSLVLGRDSVAGEIWTADAPPVEVEMVRVVGRHLRTLRPEPLPDEPATAERFARQVLLFGAAGQSILRGMTVAIAGGGGGGSLLVETLAHLGVDKIVVVDFDRVSESNLSRLVGATPADATARRLKTEVLADLTERIDPSVRFDGIYGDITYTDDARQLAEADFVFLATDTTYARYAFNAVTHQYLVSGIQVGSKVSADDATGAIEMIHVMERPVTLTGACLDCSGSINHEQLRREQLSEVERRAQDYLGGGGGEEVEDPSVITLNSISTSLASTDFLLMATGVVNESASLAHNVYYPQTRELRRRDHAQKPGCRWCDPSNSGGSFALGDLEELPLRRGRLPQPEPAQSPGDGHAWLDRFKSALGTMFR